MKKFLLALWLVIVSLGVGTAQSEITAQGVKNWIYYLASDQMKGRFPCTEQTKQIVHRLRQEYIDHGLTLLADSGFQYFEINGGLKFYGQNFLKVGAQSYVIDKDYKVYPSSDTGLFKANDVVFVGYGFDIKEGKAVRLNDYGGVNVKDKWVMILRGIPLHSTVSSQILKDYSPDYKKINVAKEHGAVGVIFVNPRYKNDRLIYYAIPSMLSKQDFPVIQVKRYVADKILGQSLDKVESQMQKRGTIAFDVMSSIELAVHDKVIKCKTQNVVALLKSNDPKLGGRYIIIGAHYDHLGLGGYESGSRMPDTVAIHNGADDNASGTTGVMELMKYLSSVRNKLGRSIIFVDFGAEEEGLLGSEYFAHHLPVPKDSIDLMINMDMIGKYKDEADFMGLGTAPELKEIFKQIEYDSTKLNVKTFAKDFGGSDQESFRDVGIPTIFVYASTAKGYHTPMDDPQYINYQGEANVLKYVAKLAIRASQYPGHFHFIKQKGGSRGGGGYGNMKVRMEIRPAFGFSGKGLKVDAVDAGGPADKAGIIKGDVIIEIAGRKINNIYDYMNVLSKIEPGQSVKIIVLRGGKKVETVVHFFGG